MEVQLTSAHIKEALDTEIMIGSVAIAGRGSKRFVFHVLMNEYRVYHDKVMIDAGQDEDALLEAYDNIVI